MENNQIAQIPKNRPFIKEFVQQGLPSQYITGRDIRDRFKISPCTFWRWRQPDATPKFPEPLFDDSKAGRWAIEDIIEWEKQLTEKKAARRAS